MVFQVLVVNFACMCELCVHVRACLVDGFMNAPVPIALLGRSLGANLTTRAVKSIMEGNVEDPEKGIQLQEFQQLVYIVYQIKS